MIDNRSDTERFSLPKIGTYNFKDVNLEDPRVWRLFQSGDTKGLFQVESELCKQWCKKIKPSNIDELSALISLVRPGGLESGFAERFANIKNGVEKPSYIHEALKPILEKTHSCLVFQESILKICIDIAGFSETEADQARRAVGKKLPEEMNRVRVMFIEGAKKKGVVPEDVALEIFSWIEKSVRYLFNSAHSYSYAYTSYFTAWQKCHFPVEFYTSALTFSHEKMDPREEIAELIQDARLHDIRILPPDIKKKNCNFEISGDKEITFGLSHIRSVGAAAIKAINKCKLENFSGFLKSIKTIKRNVAGALVKSGACDSYGIPRIQMLKCIHVIMGRSEKDLNNTPPEVKPLTKLEYDHFYRFIDDGIENALQKIIDDRQCLTRRIPTIESKIKYLQNKEVDVNFNKSLWEKLYLGLALTCSAADDFTKTEKDTITCKQAHKLPYKRKFILHAVIDAVNERKTGPKSKTPGREYCTLDVSDNTAAVQHLMMWPDTYDSFKDQLSENSVAVIYGRKDSWQGKDQYVVNNLIILG